MKIPMVDEPDGDVEDVAAAESPRPGSDRQLREYWTIGEGGRLRVRWGENGDFARCVRHLGKFVNDPKGLCASYHHDALGYWPATHARMERDKVKAEAAPSFADVVRSAYNASDAPHSRWIVEVDEGASEVIVIDDADRSLHRVPVVMADGQVSFGEAQPVRMAYVPADAEPVAASSRVVFASRNESRPPEPDVEPPAEQGQPPDAELPAPDPGPPDTTTQPDTTPPDPGGVSVSPAAEPEPSIQSEEDDVSLSAIRSRLGLPDDADENAILAQIDDVLDKATAPTPEPVAASAPKLPEGVVTIEKSMLDELRVNAAAGAQAAKRQQEEDRDRFIAAAVQVGKFTPHRVAHWTRAYDLDPEGTRQAIDSLAEGLVPVEAAGYTGTPEPSKDALDDAEAAAWGAAFGLPKEALRG